MPGLLGRHALITGSSRGIGYAIASLFLSRGCSVTLTGRDPSTLAAARARLLAEHAVVAHSRPPHAPAPCVATAAGDVAEPGFWRSVPDVAGVDILVNAAGVAHASLLVATAPRVVDEVVRTNVSGAIYGCQAIGKHMLRRGQGGVIINVASLMGVKGGRGASVYAASKAGVVGLTRALAGEMARGDGKSVRVNCLVPGWVETKMTDDMSEAARAAARESVPVKRFGTAEEMAHAAVFLAENEYANNCVLNLDGGLSAT